MTDTAFPANCVLCCAAVERERQHASGDQACPNCGYWIEAAARLFAHLRPWYAERLGVSPELVTVNTRLLDGIPDSLDAVEAVMELEELYDVDFPDSTAEYLGTLGELIRAILDAQRKDS